LSVLCRDNVEVNVVVVVVVVILVVVDIGCNDKKWILDF
jgi:hypothetical protein